MNGPSEYLKSCWWRLVCRGRDGVNRLRFGAAGPLAAECLYIDPLQVRHFIESRVTRHDTGRVLAGDWDDKRQPIDALPKIAICNRHFAEGLSWEAAGAYEHMAKLLQKKKAPDGCRNMEDVHRRYAALDDFYARLQQGAPYLTKQALGGKRRLREEGGVYIHVGHDGALLFGKRGCHRLAIARLLKLPAIPVQLGVVHAQAVRQGLLQQLRSTSAELAARHVQTTKAVSPGGQNVSH
ncbi:MAG: hypothetical protein LAT62_15265 [Natronospirillum sp.]|uniref:hypothetical protein n=1 Tax=Natronospirillum sp. TaxID=2812955 RepID=UPI0025DFD4BD|nr:hypothetical protein [Natronospirillum sp.]MCH8553297.1 hypothetical protein [Natronospirillum sp.]